METSTGALGDLHSTVKKERKMNVQISNITQNKNSRWRRRWSRTLIRSRDIVNWPLTTLTPALIFEIAYLDDCIDVVAYFHLQGRILSVSFVL